MAITQLDTVAALHLIDLQRGVVGMRAVHLIAEIIDRTSRLADALGDRGVPVVPVNVAAMAPGRAEVKFKLSPPPDWIGLVPELGDYTVTRLQVGAFYGTAVEQIFRRRGATQDCIAGIAMGSSVESTASNDCGHCRNVALVAGAMTDRAVETHRHSAEKVSSKLGETRMTRDVAELFETAGV